MSRNKPLYKLFFGVKMEKGYLLKIKKELSKYQNIPKDLYNYIENAFKKGAQEHLLPLIAIEKERKIVLEKINNLFKNASNITGLSTAEILNRADFNQNDIALGQIDAVLAELRTIIFLDNMNFCDIIPLKAKQDKECSDFIANKNGYKYSIEVFCRISKELKEEFKTDKITIKPLTYTDDLFQDYVEKARKKKKQLDNTAKENQCDKKIIVMVLNNENILGLSTFEYPKILEKISSELKWGNDYYFAIVTGLVSFDIIYPSITL